MVVGMARGVLAALLAQVAQGNVGDHFVGVHVRGGAGAPLDHVDDEVLVVLVLEKIIASPTDGGADRLIENAQLHVRMGRSFLDEGEGSDEMRKGTDRHAGDGKVVHRALRLDPVVRMVRNLTGPETVVLETRLSGLCADILHGKPPYGWLSAPCPRPPNRSRRTLKNTRRSTPGCTPGVIRA